MTGARTKCSLKSCPCRLKDSHDGNLAISYQIARAVGLEPLLFSKFREERAVHVTPRSSLKRRFILYFLQPSPTIAILLFSRLITVKQSPTLLHLRCLSILHPLLLTVSVCPSFVVSVPLSYDRPPKRKIHHRSLWRHQSLFQPAIRYTT